MISQFFHHLQHYIIEILPALAVGFFLSGLIHEVLPQSIAERYLNQKGIRPILYVTIIGIILPVCCFGSLPIAVTLRKKGTPLGPVLAFLVATPATSITAILVALRLMGVIFTSWLCLTVILMGLIIGIVGNFLKYPESKNMAQKCPLCSKGEQNGHLQHSKSLLGKIKTIVSYGFIELPREIGPELIIAIILAAVIASIAPLEKIITTYLTGWLAYIFSLVFGLLMYTCSTASVPLVHAFVKQGLTVGAGLVLLIAGPVTSYGTILVLRKEFGAKVLSIYLVLISMFSLVSGYTYFLFLR